MIQKSLNFSKKSIKYQRGKEVDAFGLHYADGKILQFISFLIDKQEDNSAALTTPNTVELEFGLKKKDLVKVKKLLSNIQVELLPSKLEEIIKCMNYVEDLESNINIRNVVGFKYSAFIDINYPNLLKNNFSAWIKNGYCKLADISEMKKMLSPFAQARLQESKAICVYQCETGKEKLIQGIGALILKDYSKQYSKTEGFSPLQSNLIKGNIIKQLNEYPQLYLAFSMTKEKLAANLYKEYEKIDNYTRMHYPDNHVLRQNTIFFDAIFFSLAYCSFIVPKYLHNTEMMKDMPERKLVCADRSKCFSWKMFNEGYSEFVIFFYLFSSIFIYLYQTKNKC